MFEDLSCNKESYKILRLNTDRLNHGVVITDNYLKILYLNHKSIELLKLDSEKCYIGVELNEITINLPFLYNKNDLEKIFESRQTPLAEEVIVKDNWNNNYLNVKIYMIETFYFLEVYDYTYEKRNQFELEHTKQQLKSTINCLHTVKEAERIIIGQEIHDDMGQGLIGLKYIAHNLYNKLKQDCSPHLHIAAQVIGSVDSMMSALKGTTSRLMPSMYEKETLANRVFYKVSEFKKISNINIKFSVEITPEDIDIRNEDSDDMIKILQEALTNVVRHSNASKVKVKLQKAKNHIALSVKDNGRGINENEINSISSFGLRGMFMRCDNKNRLLVIRGEPGKGTTVKALFYFKKIGN